MATTKTSKKVTIRPLHDRVLIQRAEAEEKTAGGILLPETAKDKPKEGKVISVGTGRINKETGKTEPLSVHVGDRVLFSAYAGNDVKINGEEYLIMREEDILGVIQD